MSLLDTHVLLWALLSPEKLSKTAIRAIEEPGSELLVSVLTFWEISLKFSLGKIELKGIAPEDLPEAAEASRFSLIDVTPQEAASFHRLPKRAHKDSFDHLLVWQAIQRNHTLVSRDRKIRQYIDCGLIQLW
ncbi:MAG: type II toxin-antitoxin system VapC family toxin [Desulfobacteraceae bacterium]|jgi:PIN domain nuclease of toxin-antitoxin system